MPKKSTFTVAEAIVLAKSEFNRIFADELEIAKTLEEVNYNHKDDSWHITIRVENTINLAIRKYKVVSINKKQEVYAIKNRLTIDS